MKPKPTRVRPREFWLIEWGKPRRDGTRFICTARTAKKAREFVKYAKGYGGGKVVTIHVREVAPPRPRARARRSQ